MVDEHATTEHIAVEDMVTACRVLVAIATRASDQEDE
jgi:tripeptide aminopeptidase